MNTTFEELGGQRFESLTTVHGSGAPVPTPFWVGSDGDALVVTTPLASGKVKRLRRNPNVELRPCGRIGRVEADSPVVSGRATVDVPSSGSPRAELSRHTGPSRAQGFRLRSSRWRHRPRTPLPQRSWSYDELMRRRITLGGSWMASDETVHSVWRQIEAGLLDLSVLEVTTVGLDDPEMVLAQAESMISLGYVALTT